MQGTYRITLVKSMTVMLYHLGIGIVYYYQEHITCFEIWHGVHNNNARDNVDTYGYKNGTRHFRDKKQTNQHIAMHD